MVKNKRTTTTTGRELFASVAKGAGEGEDTTGMRTKDSENEETKEPRRSWRWRPGPIYWRV